MAPSPAVSATGACTYYDGKADDLLAAGLGATGLAGGTPAFADPEAPTATELRRHAKYNNYRALIATSAAGGFGTFFGPTVANTGGPFNVANDGKIAGWECLEYADKPWARRNVTMMVQVPDSFNPDAPCIVTAPSSGSRGVYGAIGTSGEWGLTNAQHLDAFIGALPGYDELYIPLHVYFVEALNLMYDHLMVGTSLPASQVVHTLPRGAGAPPLTAANIPPIAAAPAPDAQISFGGNVLTIPE